MTYDLDRGVCVLFGGASDCLDQALNDTWEWNGTNWDSIITNYQPNARLGHMMGFQNLFNGVTLYGGQDEIAPQAYYDDTWGYYNDQPYSASWFPVDQSEPPVRAYGDMAFDDSLGLLIVIGGSDSTQIFHDMWAFPEFLGSYIPGDINGNGRVNGIDIVYFINYLKGGPPPPIDMYPLCPLNPNPFYAAADVNGNCVANGIDVTFFVRYLKGQVPSLLFCPDCPPAPPR